MNPPIPCVTKRSPTIDFIDQRLPRYHPVFASQLVQYDPMSKQFIPAAQPLTGNTNNSIGSALTAHTHSSNNNLTQRPEWTVVNAMKFWNGIFPEAMTKFKSTKEPKGRSKTLYHIRDKTDWDTIYDTLELARAEYQKSGGAVGWIRTVRRKAADNITPGAEAAKIASKVTPQDQIATPVVGAVEVFFDAVKRAATVRNQVLTGFDGLVATFSDVELFLSTFEGDKNIRSASIDLTASTLEAVERAIGFFISNQFFRGGKALLSGEDYEKSLLESLDTIQTKSRELHQQGLKSHIFESSMFSKQISHKVDIVVSGNNAMEQLLKDHLQQKDRDLEAARQENIRLRVENVMLRSTSPIQQSMWAPPPLPPSQAPALSWHMNQDTLRSVLDMYDLDLSDVPFVIDKAKQLPAKDRARAEQIIHTQLFRNWIVSASSAKLLIHWDFHRPRTISDISPLSAFCVTMAQALKAKDRFVTALWFCGRHSDSTEPGSQTGGRVMLLSLIDQLLRQHQFDTRPLANEFDLENLQDGNIDTLIPFLEVLVRQLPPTITIFFILDSVVLFEREEFEAEALPVFLSLIQLVNDSSVMASVKLLFTSTPSTDFVRGAFEEEELILSVDSLPQVAIASEERMVRELQGELDVP